MNIDANTREIFSDVVSFLFALLPGIALVIPLAFVEPKSPDGESKQDSEQAETVEKPTESDQ